MKMVNRATDYKMANYIRSIIDKSGISQEKWAELLNVSPRMIAYYCSGQRTPSAKRLLQIIEISESF